MRDFPSIALFTLLISMIYTGVAQFLPQRENHPPAKLERLPAPDVGPDVLSEMGKGVFDAACVACHKIGEPGGRGPDLGGVGQRAEDRAKLRAGATGQAYTDVDYLLESLCKPGDHLVEGFGNIMPPQTKILDGGQLLAVTAFLQNLGGSATVTGGDVDALARFGCPTETSGSGGAAQEQKAPDPVGAPEQVFTEFGCVNCHEIDKPGVKQGPSLYDLGKRMDRGEIYESIIDPDAKVEPPLPKEVMKATLDLNGFYTRMTPADYAALVTWLEEKKG